MSIQRSLPPWLATAFNNDYLQQALSVLADREAKRDIRRSASRQGRHRTTASLSWKPHNLGRAETAHYAVTVGASKDNSYFNRYLQLEPYDRTRIIVGTAAGSVPPEDLVGSEAMGYQQGKYLNASWVLERFGHKWWIASQAPLPQTAHTFLTLILQPITRPPPSLSPTPVSYPLSQTAQIRTVVQLTKNLENGRRKADSYFPSDVGETFVIPAEDGSTSPSLAVTLLNVEEIQDSHCVKSTISIIPVINSSPRHAQIEGYMGIGDAGGKGTYGKQRNAPVIFTHLLYTSWPDHGVPEAEDRISLVNFLHLVDRTNRDKSLSSYPPDNDAASANLDPDPPIIVGCSAGVGRTGSFIAASSLFRYLNELSPPAAPTPSSVLPPSPLGPLPDQFQGDLVVQEIDSLREQRQRMLDRPEQVLLIYEILVDTVLRSVSNY